MCCGAAAGSPETRTGVTGVPARPLPVRDGLNPTRLRLPEGGPGATVLEHLQRRWPDAAARVGEKISAGEVLLDDGTAVTPGTPFRAGVFVHLYRDPAPEVPVPFTVDVLHRDEHLLVVDKPPFLATTPRGVHVSDTVLTRLRRELDLPELSPAHRLDRLTAGVLVLTVHRAARGPYQRLFEARAVRKTYLAGVVDDADVALPRTVRSRIVKERGSLQAREVPGAVNAETRVERTGPGALRLHPSTGRTHQLRVHLAALGLPIRHDPLYPVVLADPEDWTRPLQLLAASLSLDDPFTGQRRTFTSLRGLGAC